MLCLHLIELVPGAQAGWGQVPRVEGAGVQGDDGEGQAAAPLREHLEDRSGNNMALLSLLLHLVKLT